MDDTVAWKYQSKTEDDHMVAEMFMKSCLLWIDCISNVCLMKEMKMQGESDE